MTTITPDHDPKCCRRAMENRKQILGEIYNCLDSLDACDRKQETGSGGPRGVRHAQRKLPTITYPDYPPRQSYYIPLPEKTPPWMLPRVSSRELLAGELKVGCDCNKRNGLQHDCQRLECRGRAPCLSKPEPLCYPSFT